MAGPLIEYGPEEESTAPPSEPNLLPYVEPVEGETLDDVLLRAADAHRWPASQRDEDIDVLKETLSRLDCEEKEVHKLATFILRSLSFAADPSMALRHFTRYFQNRGVSGLKELRELVYNPEHLHFLSSLFSFSNFLSAIAISHPDFLQWTLCSSRLNQMKTLDEYREDLADFLQRNSHAEPQVTMTLFKKRELLRIGIRDLLEVGGTMELCQELSGLAQSIIESALEIVMRDMESRHGKPISESDGNTTGYCVYAMGKFGGGELNFSSDVDLIYVYNEEGNTEGVNEGLGGRPARVLNNHQFFSRVSRELGNFLSNTNPEGFLFRVDARLRPEGVDGPLARSRSAYAAYLATQAGYWEKIPYIKARFIAGDPSLAALFDPIVQQFVYMGNTRETIFPEMARMKTRIDFDALTEESRELDIKRGRGGIREIEFIVAGLQLVHAEHHPELRIRPTLEVLHLLVKKGLFDSKEAARLEGAYHLFRRIEHTLQMMNETQTHRLPSAPRERAALALRCGFRDSAEFEKRLEGDRSFVRSIFQRVFEIGGEKERLTLEDYLFGEKPPPDSVLEQLRPAGLASREGFKALRNLAVGSSEFSPSARGRQDFEKLLPKMLEELPHAADPREAVRQFDRLLRAAKGYAWVYELCLSHPLMLKMFLRTLGFGPLLPRMLVAHPEWLDEIFSNRGLVESRLKDRLDSIDLTFPDLTPAEAMTSLRRFRALEGFLIAVQEVLAVTQFPLAAQRMTELAEAMLRAAAAITMRDLDISPSSGWTIIGLGGLGDYQVHFNGDLDIAFVAEDGEAGNARAVERLARETIDRVSAFTPEGNPWKVDARLRPDGASGELTAAASRFIEYYKNSAGVWEWQVLTKARPVAGDCVLGSRILQDVYTLAPRQLEGIDIQSEIRAMRQKIENSFKLPKTAKSDLKRSPGGVIDVEFIVQSMQLRCPEEAATLFPLTTAEAIAACAERDLIDADDADFLRQHLSKLRLMQRILRLLFETNNDFLPAEKEKRAMLERGMADQAILNGLHMNTIEKEMSVCRRIFRKYLD